MKICSIILTYPSELYIKFDECKRKYYDYINHDYFFLYNSPTDNTIEGKNNYNYVADCNNPSGIPIMYEKFIWFLKNNNLDDYDYIIRENSSTFVNIRNIKNSITEYKDKTYMGFYEKNWDFVSGACTIFSKDLIQELKKRDIHSPHIEDDVYLGKIMRELGVTKTFLDRYSIEHYNQIPPTSVIEEALKYPQIRIRNDVVGRADRNIVDVGIWNLILNVQNIP
jgi:hypothetical protein